MTITEAFDLYRLDYIVFSNQSAKTEENHQVCLRALLLFFGDIDMSQLTREKVRDWKIHLDKGRSPTTVRCYIIKLRVVLAYLYRAGHPVLNPEDVPVPKRVQNVPTYLTRDEVAILVKSTRRIKNKAIISFLYASGVRVSELCSLDRVQLKENKFTVVGKGGKARLCFIDERTRTLLDLYLETRIDNHPALFLTDAGERISPGVIQDTFRSVRKVSGIEAHPHTLRHSYATDLMNNGMHLYELKRLMGHSSIQSTEVYLHLTDIQLEASYKKCHTI
jgi:site-specific recombinase XerD